MEIFIKNFTIKTIIGILPQERITPQNVKMNIKINYEYKKDRYLDYALVSNLIENTFYEKKFMLLEDAAIYICNILKEKFTNIKKIKIKLSKPDILDNCTVGVNFTKTYKNN